jgi:hypothetical protein
MPDANTVMIDKEMLITLLLTQARQAGKPSAWLTATRKTAASK